VAIEKSKTLMSFASLQLAMYSPKNHYVTDNVPTKWSNTFEKKSHLCFVSPNPEILKQIVTVKMPFGKFSGRLLCDLPIEYLEWFKRKGGFPKGKLGIQLDTVYEIKLNGLEEIIRELKKRFRP
jgi:uncharacterized protein (DUF3820 family)